jgi:hypothetical protein
MSARAPGWRVTLNGGMIILDNKPIRNAQEKKREAVLGQANELVRTHELLCKQFVEYVSDAVWTNDIDRIPPQQTQIVAQLKLLGFVPVCRRSSGDNGSLSKPMRRPEADHVAVYHIVSGMDHRPLFTARPLLPLATEEAYEIPASICLLLPAIWLLVIFLREMRRSHRAMWGFCETCGYDLRASAGLCPECGCLGKDGKEGNETGT